MRGKADLFGEIHEDELIKIAWEAALKRGDAIYADYKMGYAIYADYNEYMGQKMTQGRLKPVRGGRYQHTIKRALLQGGWKPSYGHPETRFYPPSTETPLLTLLRHRLNLAFHH